MDEAVHDAVQQLSTAAEERDALVDLALALEEELEGVRARLAEYEQLHAGEQVRQSRDPSTLDVIEHAQQEANSVVEDARQNVRRIVEHHEHTVSLSLSSLEDEERKRRQQLATSTVMAGDVIRSARRNCAQLLARLVARQQVVDGWVREFSDLLDVLPTFYGTVEIPQSRKPEDSTAPRIGATEAFPAYSDAPHTSEDRPARLR